MTNPPQSNQAAKDVDDLLERHGGMYLTYRSRWQKEHHNFTHYQNDLAHADAEAKAALQKVLLEGRPKKKNGCGLHKFGSSACAWYPSCAEIATANQTIDEYDNFIKSALGGEGNERS